MDWQLLSQLGIGICSLAVLYGLARYFIRLIEKKDKWIQYIIEKFNITIENHITHNSNIIRDNTEAIKELKEIIKSKL